MSSNQNNNNGPRRGGQDIVKIYEDKNSHYTILGVFEGEYVRWSREEGNELEDEEVSTREEFEKMISDEGWREI
jgi:hypothetical protein